METKKKCERCEGSGNETYPVGHDDADVGPCSNCDGVGTIIQIVQNDPKMRWPKQTMLMKLGEMNVSNIKDKVAVTFPNTTGYSPSTIAGIEVGYRIAVVEMLQWIKENGDGSRA